MQRIKRAVNLRHSMRPAPRPKDLNVWELAAQGIITSNDVTPSGTLTIDIDELDVNLAELRENGDCDIFHDIRQSHARLVAAHYELQSKYIALQRHAMRLEKLLHGRLAT